MIGSQALVDHVAEAGLRIVNNTEFATRADVVVVADHERFDYGELRIATQAVLRGAELIGLTPRPHVPDARRPVAGRRARSSPRSRPPPGRKADAIVGKPEPAMYEAARDRLGEGKILALGDRHRRPTCSAPSAPASTPRSCSPAPPTASQVDGAKPSPTHVGDSLAALLLT